MKYIESDISSEINQEYFLNPAMNSIIFMLHIETLTNKVVT